MEINSIAVYCGSMKGNRPIYAEKAAELGKLLAEDKIQLVYGGNNAHQYACYGSSFDE